MAGLVLSGWGVPPATRQRRCQVKIPFFFFFFFFCKKRNIERNIERNKERREKKKKKKDVLCSSSFGGRAGGFAQSYCMIRAERLERRTERLFFFRCNEDTYTCSIIATHLPPPKNQKTKKKKVILGVSINASLIHPLRLYSDSTKYETVGVLCTIHTTFPSIANGGAS